MAYRTAAVRNAFNAIGVTNNISFTWPSFPLLIQPELITNENRQFCNDTHLPAQCNDYAICFCTHKLKVDLNDIVEVVLFDTALCKSSKSLPQTLLVYEFIFVQLTGTQDFYHPYHIHGHRFIVTDMGRLPEDAMDRRLDYLQENKFTRKPNSHNPPYKDTISIPNKGFVRTRFRANNPGMLDSSNMHSNSRFIIWVFRVAYLAQQERIRRKKLLFYAYSHVEAI